MTMIRLLLCALIMPSWAFAVCSTPAGDAGHIIFNTTTKTMQYCNGTNWVNTGTSQPSATQTGCTTPTGVAGEVIYASSTGVVQFCNGQNWVDTACAAKRQPNGPGCSGQPAGTIQYAAAHNELQFCDSTNWVAMGWGCSHDLSDPVWNGPTTYSYSTMQGQPFSLTPSVTDDKPGLVYSVQGTVPTGLSFNPSTGAVSGTPSALGTYTFTLRATDTSANYVERTFTIDVTPAEAVAYIASNANNVNIQSLFSGADWANSTRPKRVVINSGVTVGSTNPATAALLTGTGRGSNLIIQNSGTIAGAGGAANGGAGGPAINSQQTGVTITNAGNIYGGGGGGGRGGNGGSGGAGSIQQVVQEGPYYSSSYRWYFMDFGGYYYGDIVWAGTTLRINNGNEPASPWAYGGYLYYKSYPSGEGPNAIYRTYESNTPTTGGAGGTGGNGGAGQGSNQARANGVGGSAGAAGGTNAGTGGTGGTGGNGGTWGVAGTAGATGNTGGSGNAGAGLAGAAGTAGGAAGAAITGSGYTVTNTGSILGAY
ncbi:MAG: hypothetical protein DI628_08145 [Blastochloris viridis]|uniref:Dystroglycan-type cadherin-like domain-containing protein n=1 Tax=Blastochloris viridis TaxID=1079 RepID=A0A6N4RB07_BLAVI|nr:MAG: hypothetical protein DI628_08145 [Blastochloris viridis]